MGRTSLTDALSRGDKETELADEQAVQSETSVTESDAVVVELQRKKIEKLDEEIKDLQQDRDQRRILSYALFSFMCIYMFVAVSIVFCCGFGWMILSDKVLITLLTTTLADVIGIFGFVAKYLYHNR